jgi:hypothetical protein
MAKEGRRKWINRAVKLERTAERIADLPANVVGRGRPISDSAKRDLYEKGVSGVATVLKAPSKHRVSNASLENVGRFTVRIELSGEQAYEVNVWQAFWADEWKQMQPGMEVDCKVDPENHELVWLMPTGFQEPAKQVKGPTLNLGGVFRDRITDSSELIATGRRAIATVLSSEPMGETAPGTDDEFYLLDLELEAADEPRSWKVNFGMRVPKGAEEMVAKGKELQVAFAAVGDPDRVAVDWPATSNGRFS